MEKLKPVLDLFVDAGKKWSDDRAARLAAALAYYTLFSMAPLLILVTGFVSRYLGEFFSLDEIREQIELLIGPDAADWIMSIVEGASAPTTLTTLFLRGT